MCHFVPKCNASACLTVSFPDDRHDRAISKVAERPIVFELNVVAKERHVLDIFFQRVGDVPS
eukprot:CAMPEP_0117570530 /NCGR_PEP_ID=MMETSP0784-20121206/59249_1 /TAXON_ID=39447 /ORGANISM="" /LENGTH=61 /DNA_ID=CAMNT_0005368593 /DNA_START=202 /DNA_END=387 /DNA_ORIENTATION=-